MARRKGPRVARACTVCGVAFLWFAAQLPADDSPLVMLIQPLPADERAVKDYEPLARYLEAQSGRRITIDAPATFPAYWSLLQRNQYDLAFDGPHFTDYRTQKFGFVALAKVPDTASYSLISRRAARVRDWTRLVGRRIATLGMLSTGAARLNALFPNPARQPVLVDVATTDEGIALLRDERVEAAFLPTASVNARMDSGELRVLLVTEPVTPLLLSASGRLPPETRDRIRDALLQATDTDAGRALLAALGLERFDPASSESFANQRHALRSYWGY